MIKDGFYVAEKSDLNGQREGKMRAGISFPALTTTRLIRLLVANRREIYALLIKSSDKLFLSTS